MGKGNINNLKPQSTRTKEEQKRIAKMGGIASGKARRERKTLKEELLALLELNNNNNKISIALLEKAINGDLKAFEIVRDTIGEKPTDKIEADVNNDIKINIELSED